MKLVTCTSVNIFKNIKNRLYRLIQATLC